VQLRLHVPLAEALKFDVCCQNLPVLGRTRILIKMVLQIGKVLYISVEVKVEC
jgi:hypothetical protein